MLRLFFAAALLLGLPNAAHAQTSEAAAGIWRQSDGRITFRAADIGFPLTAGTTRFIRTAEFSHQGEGLDTGLQFESADRQVFATVYVYRPGLPHAGVTAFATDWAIHTQSPNVRPLGGRIVSGGGHDGIGIRADYAGYHEDLASSAAFIKAGGWIVKLRVSGPEARRAEVDAAMTALLDGLHFGGRVQPRPAALLDVQDCEVPVGSRGRLVQMDSGHTLMDALIPALDPAGEEAHDEHGRRSEPLPARVGAHWCRSTRARLGDSTLFILRAAPGEEGHGFAGRSVMLVPITDAGTIVEMVEAEAHRYVLYYHEIGRTAVLGSYDGQLTDEQIADILSGADREGSRIRSSVTHRANGGSDVNISVSPAATPPHS